MLYEVITVITATSVTDGSIQATCNVTVETSRVPVLVDTIIVTPANADIIETKTLQLSYKILPVDADDKTISWSASNSNATVVDGLVTAVTNGSVNINVLGTNGKVGTSSLNIIDRIPGSIVLKNESAYSQIQVGTSLTIECNYTTSTGVTVSNIRYSLELVDADSNLLKLFNGYDNTAIETTSGTSATTLSTRRAVASSELPEGQYYVLNVSMTESDGNVVIKSIRTTVADYTSVLENIASSVFIYPNPANNFVNISGLTNGVYSVNICSMQGTTIINTELDYSSEQQLNISDLPEGIYTLNISGKNINKTILLKK